MMSIYMCIPRAIVFPQTRANQGSRRDGAGCPFCQARYGADGHFRRGVRRYIRGCQGDLVEARRRWDLTLKWREEQRVDGVLSEPFPEFEHVKACYPHFAHKRARCIDHAEE
jgi:hypothetical protein